MKGRRKLSTIQKRNIIIASGVLLNVVLAFLMNIFDVPLYLDCIGTMVVTAICGLVPGLVTAVATHLLCNLFQKYAVYYLLISSLIAITTYYYVKKRHYEKNKIYLILYVAVITFISGGLGALIQWGFLGNFQFQTVRETAAVLSEPTGISLFLTGVIVNIGLNFVDKGISTIALGAILYFVPKDERISLWSLGWRRTPMSLSNRESSTMVSKKGKQSIRVRTIVLLIVAVVSVMVCMTWISEKQYFDSEKEEYTQSAVHAADFTAKMMSQYDMTSFLQYGTEAKDYDEALEMLADIRESVPCVEYLYVIRIGSDACYAVLDVETEDVAAYAVGERIEFEDAFIGHLDELRNGETIDPIESNDVSGWLITAYSPITNQKGDSSFYVGADASLENLTTYMLQFYLRVITIFSGFLILIISFGITFTEMYMTAPINAMVYWAGSFMKNKEDQKALDESVKKLRSYDIRTNDEIEDLYKAICDMAVTTVNQVRDINYFANSTAKMQNGLIITMADMVENRDSDTGAHIQKTAEYVKIISESLKKNGYYLEKLTPKYMSDVVMSAPLHDVGKINISDTILNKPGKLTEEEYEIMKLHTVYGKEIMEKAITTVKGENYLKEARNMAAYHHERWDGKGYPEGLHGEVIPLSARIMAVADVFDALTSPRVYKPAFPLEKALQILEEGSGTQFDPKCVNAFMDALPEVKQVLRKYQNM